MKERTMSGIFSTVKTHWMRPAGLIAAGLFLSLISTVGHAQSALNQVRLDAVDGSVIIQGELVDFDDGVYTIQTKIGLVNIGETAVRCSGPGCPQDLAQMPSDMDANSVRLVSTNDGAEVIGELTEFSDDIYTVNTALGAVQVSVEGIDCIGAACPQIADVVDPAFTIAGGQYAMKTLIPELLRGFAQSSGLIYNVGDSGNGESSIRLLDAQDRSIVADIAFDFQSSSGAFQAFATKAADIAIVDQGLPPIMWQNVAREYLIAKDALVLVTHVDNPIRDLTLADVAQLWSGELLSWRSLGWEEFPVTVHMSLEEANRIPAVFQDRVLNANGITNQDLGGVTVHPFAKDVVAAVAADRSAVGIVNRVAANDARSQTLDIRKSCGLTTAPIDFELKADSYPLARPVLAYIGKGDPHPVAKQFLDWTRLNEAQLRVSDAGFGGDTLQRVKLRDMGTALVQTATNDEFDRRQFTTMMRELQNADRLSITFRFERGSSRLDAESVRFVKELATRLRANEFEGSEVLLIGFADSSGDASRNTLLAQNRAEAVLAIMNGRFDAETAAGFNLQALSFGEQLPVDCNTDDAGRANNRRVEIWVRRTAG